MNLLAIKKYLKIYLISIKYGFAATTAYRVGFLIELLVEFGHNLTFFLFFAVVYSNISKIGNWNYNQILFFTGLNIVSSEIILGTLFISKLWDLPQKIKNGEIDAILTKPIHPLFNLMLTPYFSGLISTIPGFYLMYYSLSQMTKLPNFLTVVDFLLIYLFGYMICYGLSVFVGSFSFKFIGTNSFPNFVSRFITEFKAYPQGIYNGVLKTLFFYIFPVLFITSVPSSIIFDGPSTKQTGIALFLAIAFLYIGLKTWDKMIHYYASASS